MKRVMLLLMLGGVVSCHKELPDTASDKGPEKTARFFSLPAQADVSNTLKEMMADIRRQDSVHHFVPNMVDKIGYPLWQQAATNEGSSSLLLGSSSSVFLIPFQDEKDKKISAYLSCVQTDGKYSYSLHTREAIINRINKADTQKLKEMAGFGLVLAYFEKQVNKRDTLVLQGCKLPVFKNASISFQQSQKPRNLSELVWITICGDVLVNSNGQVIGVAPGGSINYGNMQYGCNTSTQWVQSFPADGSGGGGIGGDRCIAPDGSTYWWCTAGTGGGGGGDVNDPYQFQKTIFDTYLGDEDNNTLGGVDTTSYQPYQFGQPWDTIANVIPEVDFVGWGTPGISENCMSYAKAQILKKGYKISNYFTNGQTIQIYTSANGADTNAVKDCIGYLASALNRGIPVIVGVDDRPGSPNPQTDNTTDHFVVIVGMGSDANGNYFTFYDNASGYTDQGTNPNNKLYLDPITWQIKGRSQTDYAYGLQDYILTMIRKSK